MDGHKENGTFHPHGSGKPGVHSDSVDNSTNVGTGFLQRGSKKTLQHQSREKPLSEVLQVHPGNQKEIFDELSKERKKAQEMQDNSDPKLGHDDFETHWHYEGYEAGIITVKQMIEKNPDAQLLTRIRKEEDRAIEEKNKKMPIDDDNENVIYYDGYHSGLSSGAGIIRKVG